MPAKSNFEKFKKTMKAQSTRNINLALKSKDIFKSQAEKFINESKKIIDEGQYEKTIMDDLAIHAYNSKYVPYKTVGKMLEELETEREKKHDVLQPPLEDTSTYKDVKKYTKEMVNARVKNAANKKGTSMERERKFRKKIC